MVKMPVRDACKSVLTGGGGVVLPVVKPASIIILMILICCAITLSAGGRMLAQGNGVQRPDSGDRFEIVVFLKSEAVTRGQRIYLSDVAEIAGDDEDILEALKSMDLGSAPPLGSYRVLTKGFIMLRIRQIGLNPDLILDPKGAEEITVYSAGQKVTSEMIMERFAEHISGIYPEAEDSIGISLTRRIQDLILPDGALEIKIVSAQKRYGTGIDFFAEIHVDGKLAEKLLLPVKVRMNVYLPVAKRDIARSSVITAEDVELKKIEVDLGSAEIAADGLDWVIGKRAVVRIVPGTVITKNMVEVPPDVLRGSILKLRLKAGAITILMPARALQDGYVGDSIEAEIIETGKKVKCIVRDGGLADMETNLF